jgi:hypothetical protein
MSFTDLPIALRLCTQVWPGRLMYKIRGNALASPLRFQNARPVAIRDFGHDPAGADRSGNAIRTDHLQAMIAAKRAIILLRFDWLTGSIGALLS